MCPASSENSYRAAQPFREKIRQFTPNWFAVTMGNGIVSLIIAGLPLRFPGKERIALIIWGVDVALYIVFAAMFAARAIFHRETIRPLLRHPVQSMFLGAIPMGLVPIINGLVAFVDGRTGSAASMLAFILWCIDAALAFSIAVVVPYIMFTEQKHTLENVSAVLLLPIVAPEVAASSAATIAPHVSLVLGKFAITAGYVLWAMSVPLALTVLTVVFLRLLIHKLPPRELAPSSWLALGPIGTGALAWVGLGQAVPVTFSGTSVSGIANLAPSIGVIGALVLWGMGLWWLCCAILFTLRYLRSGIEFNLGWWGFTFPLGVYTAATFSLYQATHFNVFADLGLVLAALLIGLWVAVVSKTVAGVLRGHLFHAPCLVTMLVK